MRKWIAVFLALSMLICISSCSTGESETLRNNEQRNILIAYFTWADNATVDDEKAALQSALSHYESVGDAGSYTQGDAMTSASVLPPGNTAKMAEWIQQRIGGDLFSIMVTEPYSGNYDECLDRAADEKAVNDRPELANHIDNIEDYDVIFLGYPNWWYTAPMAVFSFIEEYDLSDKTIIPFCAHGTGGIAGSVKDVTAALPDSVEILEPIGVYRSDINEAQPIINEWLDKLGFVPMETSSDSENADRKLIMIVKGREITVTLYDTPEANALYEMLPLELTFEDYNGIEKISYLSQELPTERESDGHAPNAGDLCLYAPWGNIAVFYQNFRYSEGLIMLGHIDSGIDIISEINGNFSAILKKSE